ncbi:hypothetical protein VHEMI02825 [[Torrubiella] hemipterigena]|uniref:DUF3669 domain-containing protein n=1 Tax=[Torrubiella] hemipterigena TaxID=1531966 RepID=A0A0A1T920_9HYPO|nr:hypothetical protein VHEMI02825 [[Torrubiella] hemipterigena]
MALDTSPDISPKLAKSLKINLLLLNNLGPDRDEFFTCLTDMLAINGTTPLETNDTDPRQFRQAGEGECGTVFTRDKGCCAVKVAKIDEDALYDDYEMHTWIDEQFFKLREKKVNVPYCYDFFTENSSENPELRRAIAAAGGCPTAAMLETERIPPLPQRVREELIRLFCDPARQDMALADDKNKDCLVRLYLGSLNTKPGGPFSLRDFNLHLNDMRKLQLPTAKYADCMAYAMAVLHWEAMVDARGVEFVLGGSRFAFAQIRTTQFWVIDFDQCQLITLDNEGVDHAIEAAKANDPFLPALGAFRSQSLVWTVFCVNYLNYSHEILDKELWHLPERFLRGLAKRPPVVPWLNED